MHDQVNLRLVLFCVYFLYHFFLLEYYVFASIFKSVLSFYPLPICLPLKLGTSNLNHISDEENNSYNIMCNLN